MVRRSSKGIHSRSGQNILNGKKVIYTLINKHIDGFSRFLESNKKNGPNGNYGDF
ncbi:hypothetical protein NEF87_004305 [Candidatus Lokiarchaeum ossiferum]|uniref:Uncharacterized protein n=1 Tax=Candidatus Lokiarchaeum ossiferum TaxID=2951803 RepID=A0ABY6HX76_9ARCH|nr:hypothetical protein NEF87_004305 [Candidatus Lokiarchaeum sp. B-35]